MKGTESYRPSLLAAHALKVAGLIMAFAVLVDFAALLLFSGLPDNASALDALRLQLSITSQIVDRGIIPLIGIALFLAGLWIDSVSNLSRLGQKFWRGLRLGILLYGALLGLLFLLIVPLHVNNAIQVRRGTLEQIAQQATNAETQLTNRLLAEANRQQTQINGLVQNEPALDQAVVAGQISAEEAKLIRGFKQDPKSLDKFIQDKVKQSRNQLQQQVRSDRVSTEKRAKQESLKALIQTPLSSLLLAIGYILVSWAGLREANPTDRKAAPRPRRDDEITEE